ncbi:hypothetical protein HY416_02300 [Candidatus Kaiserbacteria bacterium]|nr:hypothetical protein [Candidatus Kaiserbacteria bacterium]
MAPQHDTSSFLQLNLLDWVAKFLDGLFGNTNDPQSFYQTASDWWYIFSIASFAFSALLLLGIVYSMIRFSQLAEDEQGLLRDAEHAYRTAHAAASDNTQWPQILAHVSSDDPNNWRLAIIEADIMLDELLDRLGYQGASIGDRLKTVDPHSFHSIEDAWEAHKIRNAIAHRGSDFVLTKRAAQEAIARYQHVFEEFKFI